MTYQQLAIAGCIANVLLALGLRSWPNLGIAILIAGGTWWEHQHQSNVEEARRRAQARSRASSGIPRKLS